MRYWIARGVLGAIVMAIAFSWGVGRARGGPDALAADARDSFDASLHPFDY